MLHAYPLTSTNVVAYGLVAVLALSAGLVIGFAIFGGRMLIDHPFGWVVVGAGVLSLAGLLGALYLFNEKIISFDKNN